MGSWFIGIDWGEERHAVCLLDATGTVQEQREVPHSIDAVRAWLASVQMRTGVAPAAIGVAIETPHGLLIDTLLDHGFMVFAINPKQLDRFRDRFSAAGAKDDRRDAHVLGDALRTDPRAFRRVQPEDPLIQELREVARAEDDWKRDLRRFTNRIREQVVRTAPRLLTVCPAADEAWFWALLELMGPRSRASVPRPALRALLKRHRIRRLAVEDVWALVQQDDFVPAPGVAAGAQVRLVGLIAQARLATTHQRQCVHHIDQLLQALAAPTAETEPREHRDVEILLSLPGLGRLTAATMLTEAARPVAERDYHTLRAVVGSAPVTRRSGKSLRIVTMRRACSGRLRAAVYHWGGNSILRDGAARAYYERLRHRGQTHGRALRAVTDRWLRILVAMLTHRTLYDANRFLSASTAA